MTCLTRLRGVSAYYDFKSSYIKEVNKEIAGLETNRLEIDIINGDVALDEKAPGTVDHVIETIIRKAKIEIAKSNFALVELVITLLGTILWAYGDMIIPDSFFK